MATNDQPAPHRPDAADQDQPAEGGDLPEAGPGAERAPERSDVGEGEPDDAYDAGPDLSALDDVDVADGGT
jgi:hypothetical protein